MNRTILKKLVICLLLVSFYYIPYVAAEEPAIPFDVTTVLKKPHLNADDKGGKSNSYCRINRLKLSIM